MSATILFIGVFLAGLPLLLFRLNYQVHMLQLNSYMTQRYVLWLRRNLGKIGKPVDFLLLCLLLAFALWAMFGQNTELVTKAAGIIHVTFGAVWLTLFFLLVREKTQAKKKLKYTARVKRLFATAALLILGFLGVLPYGQAEPLTLLFFLGLLQLLVFVLVILSNLLLFPVEKGINAYYYRDAQKKVQGMPHLQVIGITGSYGKTSTKHILQKILSKKYNVLMTPGSYNTTMGVILTIRQSLSPLHDFFITEMGAKKPGDVAEICQLVKPSYGILTSIGPTHLETFLTQENVQKTKYELIQALPPEGLGILNYDDDLIVEGLLCFGKKDACYVTYGIAEDEQTAGRTTPLFYAEEIRYSEKGTEFTVVHSLGGQKYSFRTKLLGKHNLYNILAGISLAFSLGMDYKAIYAGVKDLEPIAHRLQIKRQQDYVLIDDAYNANPVGTRAALEVLGLISGNKKILVTPGMIELGSQEYELNKAFARQAAEVCDYIVLVGEKRTKPLQDGLREANYSPEKYTVVKDIFAAFQLLEKIKEKNDIVLIENDLTDDYDE